VQYLKEGNARVMRITAVKFCRKCGAAIPPDSPQESCGACLLEMALDQVEPEHEVDEDLALEIAHVLLIDVVGYSKLLVNEQIELLQNLNQIVRVTESFRAAEATGKLIRVPTGDGMALLFFHSPEEPVRCALEISRALQERPHIQLRMGVHSGPINRIPDVNDKTNIAGSGINIAQRVLDCGDAGHILLSKHIAEDLTSYRQWQPFLHDLGECEVKHGLRLHLFNLYKDGLGNPQIPEKLKRRRREHGASKTHENKSACHPERSGSEVEGPPRRQLKGCRPGFLDFARNDNQQPALMCLTNQSLASCATFSSAPGSSKRCVAPGIIASFTSQRILSRACSFNSMTMSSLPPTMSRVGACTFGKALSARSGRPPRDTTAPTSCGASTAATSAAAPPVLEPK
jgi:class 3 adenylate cyclase